MPELNIVKQLKEIVSMSRANSDIQEVDFQLYAPDAKKVCIAGQFNDWSTRSNPMKKSKDGTWRAKIKLSKGRCEYKYFADGTWVQEISGAETVPNPFGTCNCVINIQ